MDSSRKLDNMEAMIATTPTLAYLTAQSRHYNCPPIYQLWMRNFYF